MQHSTNSDGTHERLREHLRATAHWMDELIAIPGTSWKLGLDAIMGFVPVVGDITGAVLGLWLVREARAGGVPIGVRRKMLKNLVMEMVLGFVPVLGDIFDVAFRANSRNRALVEDWLDQQDAPKVHAPRKAPRYAVWVLLLGGLLATVAYFTLVAV